MEFEPQPGELVFIQGPNFSGRTKLARESCGLPPIPFESVKQGVVKARNEAAPIRGAFVRGAFVGNDPCASLSGIAVTANQEFEVHSGLGNNNSEKRRGPIFEVLAKRNLLDRNPFTLSGGEQAILAVGVACATQSDVVAIDIALEHLAPDFLDTTLQELRAFADTSNAVVIVDNRWNEGHFDIVDRKIDVEPQSADVPRINSADCKIDVASMELQLNHLNHEYRRGVPVLKDVTVTMQPGNIYHLRGSNGAGKTTLAKILSGILKYTNGDILIGGRKIRPWKDPASIAAYHFQNADHQFFRHSVRAELRASVPPHRKEPLHRAEQMASVFGLLPCLQSHPLDLPYVLRKRLALATAVCMERPWLIVDEPTLGQDLSTTKEIASLLLNVAAQGQGIILISHSQTLARLVDSKILELKDGCLMA